jgi:membrane protein implicated in regulation of membrane protease activity
LAVSVTAALIVAGVLGIWFSTTRAISIGAIALLVFLHPWLVVLVLIGSATAFYLFRIRKQTSTKEKS